MTNSRKSDGQVIVIFAGALFLLVAIAALIVDLGFVFTIRRQEQNAADPGAIAAARFLRAAGDPRAAACLYAHQNGFFNAVPGDTTCASSSDANGATLAVVSPPSSAAGPSYAGRPGFIEV